MTRGFGAETSEKGRKVVGRKAYLDGQSGEILKKTEKDEKLAKMPADLCPSAQKLWTDCVERWEMDDRAALTHLANACRSLTRLRTLENILQKDGMVIPNRFKQPSRHPAYALMTAESKNFREHMAALQLDIESLYKPEAD